MMIFLEFLCTDFLPCERRVQRQGTVFLSQESAYGSLQLSIEEKRGKSSSHLQVTFFHFFLQLLQMIMLTPCQTQGEALLAQTLSQKFKSSGGKDTGVCLLVVWLYPFSSFLLSRRLFLYFVLQLCHQPNKRSRDRKYYMFFLGFIPLSQPILFYRRSTGHIFRFSILSWEKN